MGHRPQRHSWADAKKLCRLNQNDIMMAKSLGFRPDVLVRARPDPRQKWKLAVKDWIRELHFERFGNVLGEEALPVAQPTTPQEDAETARLFGEQLYWEEYHERNADCSPGERRTGKPDRAATRVVADRVSIDPITDDDVPF